MIFNYFSTLLSVIRRRPASKQASWIRQQACIDCVPLNYLFSLKLSICVQIISKIDEYVYCLLCNELHWHLPQFVWRIIAFLNCVIHRSARRFQWEMCRHPTLVDIVCKQTHRANLLDILWRSCILVAGTKRINLSFDHSFFRRNFLLMIKANALDVNMNSHEFDLL